MTLCVFLHQCRRLYLTVHGDDFFAPRGAADAKLFEENLLQRTEPLALEGPAPTSFTGCVRTLLTERVARHCVHGKGAVPQHGVANPMRRRGPEGCAEQALPAIGHDAPGPVSPPAEERCFEDAMTWSATQATVALSSAEAKLIALVKGTSEGLAVQSWMTHLGEECGLRVGVSSAATRICKEMKTGRIRHLGTRLQWIQGRVRDGTILTQTVSGRENPADSMTKHLAADSHMVRLDC